MPRTSPKNTPCLYCGKLFTQKGIWSHEQYACKKSPHRKKRVFGKKRCAVCGKSFHAAGLRSHMATQHPREFAVEKNRKPTSRSARRRDMPGRAKEKWNTETPDPEPKICVIMKPGICWVHADPGNSACAPCREEMVQSGTPHCPACLEKLAERGQRVAE